MSLFTTSTILSDTIAEFFERDIRKLIEEIKQYRDEAQLWTVIPGISNSAGNLCLHLTGNLNHFVGAVMAKSGYIRDRDNEFTAKGIVRDKLISDLEETSTLIRETLTGLKEKDFEKDYPVQKHGKTVSTAHMLLHLLTHFNYHMGQVNYHRRVLQGAE